jgi:mannan endo-1,4-beta-mannosidase
MSGRAQSRSPPRMPLFVAVLAFAILGIASAAPRVVGNLSSQPDSYTADGFDLPVPWANDASFPFLAVRGTQIVTPSGSAVYHVGANYWQAAHVAAFDKARLEADFDALADAGVTFVRILGLSEGPNNEPWRVVPALQPCPGLFDAAVLDGLDYAIYQLGKRRMRATLVLGNEWPWSGGFAQYVRWAQRNATMDAGGCSSEDALKPNMSDADWRSHGFQHLRYPGPGRNSWSDWQQTAGLFYGSPEAQALWRDAVRFIVTRRNRYTGLALTDDPTVAILQIANEPRVKGGSSAWSVDTQPFLAFLTSAAAFIKKLAPRQLISSGMEGDTAAMSVAQSMLLSQNITNIDVLTAHAWPQNFNWLDPSDEETAVYALKAARAYITAHIATAAALQRPLIVEEFGWPRDWGSLCPSAPTTWRDKFYELIFSLVIASAESQGVLAGAAFWGYSGRGRPDARYNSMPITTRDLCGATNITDRALDGGAVDWAACFFDADSRPLTCPYWIWTVQSPAAWPNATMTGQTAFLHDPPHEAAGWYSIYNSDGTTLAVIKSSAARLKRTTTCASVALHTAAAAQHDPAMAVDAAFGSAACVAAVGPPSGMVDGNSPADGESPHQRACAAAGASGASTPPATAVTVVTTPRHIVASVRTGAPAPHAAFTRVGSVSTKVERTDETGR